MFTDLVLSINRLAKMISDDGFIRYCFILMGGDQWGWLGGCLLHGYTPLAKRSIHRSKSCPKHGQFASLVVLLTAVW